MENDTPITCLRCGAKNSPDLRYCDYCGDRLERTCSHCGHSNPPEAKYYCENCKQPLVGATSETTPEPSASNESTPKPSAPAPVTGIGICPRCQHSNEPGSSYCYHCGLPLDDEIIPGSPSAVRAFQQGTPGGFWVRFVAYILDLIVVTVGNVMIYALLGEDMVESLDPENPFVFADLISAVFGLLYTPTLIGLWSTTVGKKPFELYIVRTDGGRCGFWRAFGRELAKVLSALILFVGFLMIAFRSDKRGLHDLIAGTVVIKR